MALRLFCYATTKHARMFCRYLSIPKKTFGHGALQPSLVQQLHVKVYDKDAGLEAQREANRDKEPNGDLEPKAAETITKLGNGKRTNIKIGDENVEAHKNEFSFAQSKETHVNLEDSDTFGNSRLQDGNEDEGDRIEEEYISRPTRRWKKLSTRGYAFLIKEHLIAHNLKEAIAILEERMLKEDRVQPDNYIFNLLISGCAKEGYTRKAFSLFTKMRQRGLKVTGGTYTSLFNACANAPSVEDGLGRVNRLREIMLESGYEPNAKNYNVMIKAYGRCGDVKTAFQLVDEMMERKVELNRDTFNFLLQACASDNQFGFRHCLLTWHKMLQRGITPDYYTFHIVLRCVRDCGFVDLPTMQQVLQQILRNHQNVQINQETENQNLLQLQEPTKIAISESGSNEYNPFSTTPQPTNNLELKEREEDEKHLELPEKVTNHLEMPNLLLPQPHLGSMVSLTEIKLAHERFLLLGGITGYLELMKQHKVTPNIQLFTTMLEVAPPTNAAEKQILTFIRRIGLKADIDFFNVLIKKRAMRFDYEGAKEVLSMIRTAGLHPDIVTYGVLALGCRTEEEAKELLQTMKNSGIRMNIQILGAMLRQGCAQKEFPYVTEIIQISLDEHIKPNDVFLRHLHNFYNQCARAIDARHPFTKAKSFKKAHGKFCDKLRLYYEEQGIEGLKLEDAIKKVQERPYQQYKEKTVEGIEQLKNEKQARKQKLRKYIKKIKIANLRGDDDEPTDVYEQKRIE